MFGNQDARGERIGGIARLDRDRRLTQHVPAVELFGDQMDRCTRDGIARRDRAGMGVEPLIYSEGARDGY